MNNYAVITIGYKSLNNIINRVNEAYTDGSPNEFILIINHYSEESLKILEYAKNEPRITRYVYCSQNIGFSKAMNLGYRIANSEYLILLSDDCASNSETYRGLTSALIPEKNGISCVAMGGRAGDIIPTPQGFLIAVKKQAIKLSGDYIYDEEASPLGCERELTYRLKASGFNLEKSSACFYSHVHDISNNPQSKINYLGNLISPQGENAFQPKSEIHLELKVEEHKKKI